MKVSYGVDIKEIKRARSEERKAIETFLESAEKSMCLEYSDNREAQSKYGIVSDVVKRVNKSLDKDNQIKRMIRDSKIYVVKGEGK